MLYMTTKIEMAHLNDLVKIIQRNGSLSKVQLVTKSNISISYFEKLRPFLLETYDKHVKYDRETKMFVALIPAQVAE